MTQDPQSAAAAAPALSPKDEKSIVEARELVERAFAAYQQFQNFSQEQVDRVVEAVANAAAANAEKLAKIAVEESTFGVVADKVKKNLFAAQNVFQAIRPLKTVGVVMEDRAQGILEIAVPVGVVAAILPSTNPTSTTIYKTLIALKGRNAIVLVPHPRALKCCCDAAAIMREAAVSAGAPADVICCFQTPTLAGTQELMRHKRTSVILATGGLGMVRAAYSSGKPAFGVGPGNVPAFIDRTADIAKAVADVVYGTTFDNGTICSSEQAIVAEEAIRPQVVEQLKRNGAYFLSAAEAERLGREMVNTETHTINPKFVGKTAVRVAELAGLNVPQDTRVLIAELNGVGKQHPLSAEKLSPVLALYFVKERAAGFDLCYALLRFGGLGHTCAIHARDEAVVREYGLRMPAARVVVNSPSPQGSIGASTNLFPAMTLGCGAIGGNITSDNISPLHLVNLRRVAYETRSVTGVGTQPAEARPCAHSCSGHGAFPGAVAEQGSAPTQELSLTERQAVARAIERFVAKRNTVAGDAAPRRPEVKDQKSLASPAPVVPERKLKPLAAEFVSVAEVRAAIKRKQKILVGAKTILTPAARDLAAEYDVLLQAEE